MQLKGVARCVKGQEEVFPPVPHCVVDREQCEVILLFPGAPDPGSLREVACLACCIIDPACQRNSLFVLNLDLHLESKQSFNVSEAESRKTSGFCHQGCCLF